MPLPSPDAPLSIYAHIPFCHVKCSYCAFNIIVGRGDLIPAYVNALTHEMQLTGQPGVEAHTLYLGGGTPSTLSPGQVATIIAVAREYLGLRPGAEITIEANPTDLDIPVLCGYRAAGVNRLSLGVQSAHTTELQAFGREHSFPQAEEAFRAARAAGFDNISVDLIFGAPGQTLPQWRESLDRVLAWGPDHFSLYAFILERGTKMFHRLGRGEAPAPDDDLTADMYDYACAALGAAGYHHYEIASWARPSCESQHNRQYWRNLPFLGLGPGAHGYAAGTRYWNARSVPGYIHRMEEGERQPFPFSPALEGCEAIPHKLEMAETVILGLRMVTEGVNLRAFEHRFGAPLHEVFGPTVEKLTAQGLLTTDERGASLLLTPRAYLISNRVFVEFFP